MGTVATCWGLKEVTPGKSCQDPGWEGLLEHGHGMFFSVDQRSKPQMAGIGIW